MKYKIKKIVSYVVYDEDDEIVNEFRTWYEAENWVLETGQKTDNINVIDYAN